MAHYDGVNWNSHSNSGGFGGTAIQGNVTRNSVSTFSIFTLGSTSATTNPLSVKFTNVKAYTAGARNVVEWTNLSEAGVQGYAVEKSTDGLQFTVLTEVAARSNAARPKAAATKPVRVAAAGAAKPRSTLRSVQR